MKREDFFELRYLAQQASREHTRVVSMCEGKAKYASKSMAEKAVRKGKPVCVFRCMCCGHWHVGGAKTRREQRLASKRRKDLWTSTAE